MPVCSMLCWLSCRCRLPNNLVNIGSKWIKLETPNNTTNGIGEVRFHIGAFRPSAQYQPTLNPSERNLSGFVGAKNRTTMAQLRAD